MAGIVRKWRTLDPASQSNSLRCSHLRSARRQEDERLEAFFRRLEPAFWSRTFSYTNNKGRDYIETAHVVDKMGVSNRMELLFMTLSNGAGLPLLQTLLLARMLPREKLAVGI